MRHCPYCYWGPPTWCAEWHEKNHPGRTYNEHLAAGKNTTNTMDLPSMTIVTEEHMNRLQHRERYAEELELEDVTTALSDFEPTLTIQDAPDADINELMVRFGVTDGSLLPGHILGVADPKYYGDFTDVPDLRETLERMKDAEVKFGNLPAAIRRKFGNDPLEFLDWTHNPANAEEAVTLGILHKTPPKAKVPPIEVIVTNPPDPEEVNT